MPPHRVRDGAHADPDSTIELLARVRPGDQSALDVLLERSLPALRRWARGRLPRYARGLLDAQDLLQDTVVQTIRRLDTFESAMKASARSCSMRRVWA